MGRAPAPTQPRAHPSVTTDALHLPPPAAVSAHPGGSSHHAGPRGHLPSFVVAVLALVLAIGSAGLALVAVGLASGANDRIGKLVTGPAAIDPAGPVVPVVSHPPGATSQPAPAAASPDGALDVGGDYTVRYTAEDLQLQTARCRTVALDLDEPRVGVQGETTDLAVTGECDHAPAFELPHGVVVARADTAEVTPNACAEGIRRAPLSPDIPVPVQRGIVLCAATSRDAARTQGITRKIVVLTVRAVDDDGLVSVRVAAWNVPG
jgi:hypothetical protein